MILNLHAMGNNSSLPKGRRKSLRSFVRKSHSRPGLSHTFTVPDIDEQMELLNINIATEEELMTLPGVNREIAKSIVDHRKAIGRYRKVEDLALVKGIGAQKLEIMKPEICVSIRRNQSISSRAPSYDSLRSTDSRITTRSGRLVNINKATVFELQSVPGITQEIAAGILTHRNKKGYFRKIDDLLKVKHISRMRLDNISKYLTAEDSEDNISESSISRPSILTNGFLSTQHTNGRFNRPSFRGHVPNGLTASTTFDIFELLSTYSPRPILSEVFKNSRNGEAAARIGSWNLHKFTQDKAANLGVKEVICRTILENGLSLLAVQGIKEVIALKTICEELNKPTLRRVEEWKENSQNWNFCMLDVHDSQLGFIYDSGNLAHIELRNLLGNPAETQSECDALIAHFLIGDINLQLVNLALKAGANVALLSEKIADLISEEETVVLCIDLANFHESDDSALALGGLTPIFPSSTNTQFPALKAGYHSSHISNILVNAQIKQYLTGYKNIVSKGITHLAIPNGWSWGGPVSSNCPIWMELFLARKSEDSNL